jgi:hypothetical protein
MHTIQLAFTSLNIIICMKNMRNALLVSWISDDDAIPDRQSMIFQSLMLCESFMNSFHFLYILLLLLGFGLLSYTAVDSVQQQSINVIN